jgi:transcriptional regulator with XRE-family HTH domain
MNYIDISMTDIKILKQIRKRHSLSLEAIAREMGLSYRTIFRWIHGESLPSPMARQRLAEYIKRQKEIRAQP